MLLAIALSKIQMRMRLDWLLAEPDQSIAFATRASVTPMSLLREQCLRGRRRSDERAGIDAIWTKFGGDVAASAARKTAVEQANSEPAAAHTESNASPAGPIAADATNPEPPTVADAAVGAEEKGLPREADAVDADNLTDMLNRLSQDRPPKVE